MKRLVFFIPLFGLGLLLALLAAPLLQGKNPSVLPSAMIGRPAPDFVLPSALRGRGFSSDDLRSGEVSVVNVFASWCVTCAAEQEILEAMSRDSGVPVYGIVYKDRREAVEKWLEQHGNPYKATGFDENGRVSIDWGVYGVPETFVVDGRGIIRYRHVGALTREESADVLQPLLARLKE